jgi:hypothetical protein
MAATIRSAFWGLCALVLGACAHPMTIAPDLGKIEAAGAPTRPGTVGLYIAADDKARQVTTAGGGGDKVSYYPYRDLEAGIYKVLGNLYERVILVPSPTDAEALARDGVSVVARPQIVTQSSSGSILTWPPTDFQVQLACRFTDVRGATVAETFVTGKGTAEFAEFASDFSLAGKRASEDALNKAQRAIAAEPKLR